MQEEEIFNQIKKSFNQGKSFDSFLKKSVRFDNRSWTYGQFLYKYFYDQLYFFNQKVKENEKRLDILPPAEQKLAKKIISMHALGLDKPTVNLNDEKIKKQVKDLNLFDGDKNKENFYTELFTHGRSVKGNPCYWPVAAQYQFLVIEHKLKSELGMSDDQVRSLMIHCEEKREKTEKHYKNIMPNQFWHNSPVGSNDMKFIEARWRPVDNWVNVQNYCFMTTSKSFHSELPVQGENEFVAWPRFNPKVCAFFMSKQEFEEKTKNGSYNYEIDMSQKDSFRPVIPLWGGAPKEWVSVRNVNYKSAQKETLADLKGMKFYLIEDENVWNVVQGKGNLSPQQAEQEMKKLCEQGDAVLYVPSKTSEKCIQHFSKNQFQK